MSDEYIPSRGLSSSEVEAREHQTNILAKRTTDIPNDLQIRTTYTADDYEEYIGYAARGVLTSQDSWLIRKQTYNSGGYMVLSQTAEGAWDNRASLVYA